MNIIKPLLIKPSQAARIFFVLANSANKQTRKNGHHNTYSFVHIQVYTHIIYLDLLLYNTLISKSYTNFTHMIYY